MLTIAVVPLDNVIICMKVGETKSFSLADHHCFGLYRAYWFVLGGGHVISTGI